MISIGKHIKHLSVNWNFVLWIQKFITEETTASNIGIYFIIHHVFNNSKSKRISQNCFPYIIRLAKAIHPVKCKEMKVHLGAWPLISAHDDNLLPMAIHERKYDFTKLSSSAIKKILKKKIRQQFRVVSLSKLAQSCVICNCCLHTGICRHPSLVTEEDLVALYLRDSIVCCKLKHSDEDKIDWQGNFRYKWINNERVIFYDLNKLR